MKRYPLTSTRQKIFAIVIDVFLITFHLLVYFNIPRYELIFLIFALLTLLLCAFYTKIIFESQIVINEVARTITIKMISKTLIDLTSVSAIAIEERLIASKKRYVIAFYDSRRLLFAEINPFLSNLPLESLEVMVESMNQLIDA
ncbi:MAG: hypothetical protein PHW40_05565 [Candidatus Izemoplasmatales bacterium]|nr:hypothetical protein [Candidatus Izemoplasmatales bacterium]MDD5293760.1 hypothetical protein [Candidatus Izemoplasmatales bacterium]